MSEHTSLAVDCYAGYRGEQEPRSVCVDGAWIGVARVLRRWAEPGRRGFDVELEDRTRLRLLHDETRGTWTSAPAP